MYARRTEGETREADGPLIKETARQHTRRECVSFDLQDRSRQDPSIPDKVQCSHTCRMDRCDAYYHGSIRFTRKKELTGSLRNQSSGSPARRGDWVEGALQAYLYTASSSCLGARLAHRADLSCSLYGQLADALCAVLLHRE